MTRLPSLGPRGEGWVVIQFVLLGLIAWAGTLGPAWDGTARTVTTIAGAALLAAGGILAAKGLLDLRDALTPLPHPRDGAELVDTGSYALVRHPIYGGLVLGALGLRAAAGVARGDRWCRRPARLLPSQVRARGALAGGPVRVV